MIRTRTFTGPLGPLCLAASPAGLVAVAFGPCPPDAPAPAAGPGAPPGGPSAPGVLEQAAGEIEAYLAGRPGPMEVAVDWPQVGVGAFARTVLEALSRVPRGTVVTYGELAVAVGRPGAARAVGSAMAANPLPLVMPCHRVVAAGGHLRGYSGGDGLATKRWLLELEGVPVHPDGRVASRWRATT